MQGGEEVEEERAGVVGGEEVRLPLLLLFRAGLRMLRGAARRRRGEEEPSRARFPPASSCSTREGEGEERWGEERGGEGREGPGKPPRTPTLRRAVAKAAGSPAAPRRPGRSRAPGFGLGENCSCSRSPSSTQSYVIEVWMRNTAQAKRGNCSSAAALPLRPSRPATPAGSRASPGPQPSWQNRLPLVQPPRQPLWALLSAPEHPASAAERARDFLCFSVEAERRDGPRAALPGAGSLARERAGGSSRGGHCWAAPGHSGPMTHRCARSRLSPATKPHQTKLKVEIHLWLSREVTAGAATRVVLSGFQVQVTGSDGSCQAS